MNFKKILVWILTLMMVMGLVPTVSAANVAVTGVTINKDFTWITVGVMETLSATVSPSNATNQSVTWSSSAPNVATVDSSGNVKAIRPGDVTITVKTADGSFTDSCTFKVVSVEETQITRDTVLILDNSGSMSGTPLTELKKAAKNFSEKYIGTPGINRLAVIIYDTSVSSSLDFTTNLSSINSAINSMNASGMTNITAAVKKANSYLEASTADIRNMLIMTDGLPNEGEYVSSGKYTSSDYSSYSYANALYNTAVAYHSEYRIFTFGFFHDLTGSSLTFGEKLLDDIKNAKFFNVKDAADLDDEFEDILDDLTEMSVTLNKSSLELNIGESEQLIAKIHPDSTDNKNVTWSVADPSIASVDSNGNVKGISVGETIVTVTTEKENHTASCKVTVVEDLNDTMLMIGSATSRAGKTVSLPITLLNNPGIAGVSFKIQFDSTMLTLKEVDISPAETTWELISHNLGNSPVDGKVSFSYSRKNDYVSNNTLATLVFEVAADAPTGEYPVEIYYYDACDQYLNDVYLRRVNGKVTVENSIIGDTNADGVIDTKDAVLLAQYLAGWSVTPDLVACDCNVDGKIDTRDAVLLSQYLADWDVTLG